jgi:hypothetical protein
MAPDVALVGLIWLLLGTGAAVTGARVVPGRLDRSVVVYMAHGLRRTKAATGRGLEFPQAHARIRGTTTGQGQGRRGSNGCGFAETKRDHSRRIESGCELRAGVGTPPGYRETS